MIGEVEREKNRLRSAAWRKAHPEQAAAVQKAWRLRNPDRLAAAQVRFRAAHPEASARCNKAYRERNPQQSYAATRKHRYNISAKEFEVLLAAQGGSRAICQRIPQEAFHVDHDHSCCAGKTSCGKCIRGLLCRRCNTALGYLRDDVQVLQSAILYLHKGKQNG